MDNQKYNYHIDNQTIHNHKKQYFSHGKVLLFGVKSTAFSG